MTATYPIYSVKYICSYKIYTAWTLSKLGPLFRFQPIFLFSVLAYSYIIHPVTIPEYLSLITLKTLISVKADQKPSMDLDR